MSWESWLQHMLERAKDQTGQCHIQKCAIIGHDGATWAVNNVENPSCAELASAFENFPSETNATFDGISYFIIRKEDEGVLVLKARGHGAASIMKTAKAWVVGVCDEGLQPGKCTDAVYVTGKELKARNL